MRKKRAVVSVEACDFACALSADEFTRLDRVIERIESGEAHRLAVRHRYHDLWFHILIEEDFVLLYTLSTEVAYIRHIRNHVPKPEVFAAQKLAR